MNLYDKSSAAAYYDDLYSKNYMAGREAEIERRILEVIGLLGLPDEGDALDFGCGTGTRTSLIKKALPRWRVYGADVSSIALERAQKMYPELTFCHESDPALRHIQFNLIFSHHVLEHVYDVKKALDGINALTKPTCHCLHILPCGNTGSFEYRLSVLQKNGIDVNRENRFFFETDSHLRRLDTERMNELMARYGFRLVEEFYSLQFYGTLEVYTRDGPKMVMKMTPLRGAKDNKAFFELMFWRSLLLSLNLLRWPAILLNGFYRQKRAKLTPRKRLFGDVLFLLSIPIYPVSQALNLYLEYKSKNEWKENKHNRRAANMYLHFVRA